MKSEIPAYVRHGLTSRQWKAKKRRELRAITKAFELYRFGCAYCPCKDGEVGQIQHLLNSMQQKLSARSWGR